MGKKVLVVDDSRTVRQQVGATLMESGYDVIEACDGVDALERLTAGDDIAMMLCDVNMPKMNGLELLVQIKAKAIDLPVLMLTTDGRPGPIAQAKAAGAKGWMVKPFKSDLLLAAVRKMIGDP
jgi:two-component system chemotaxis response regulator CheY